MGEQQNARQRRTRREQHICSVNEHMNCCATWTMIPTGEGETFRLQCVDGPGTNEFTQVGSYLCAERFSDMDTRDAISTYCAVHVAEGCAAVWEMEYVEMNAVKLKVASGPNEYTTPGWYLCCEQFSDDDTRDTVSTYVAVNENAGLAATWELAIVGPNKFKLRCKEGPNEFTRVGYCLTCERFYGRDE